MNLAKSSFMYFQFFFFINILSLSILQTINYQRQVFCGVGTFGQRAGSLQLKQKIDNFYQIADQINLFSISAPFYKINPNQAHNIASINEQQLVINFYMGNIEIRDHSNSKRRTQIFTERKSYDAARSQYRKSLTQRYERSSRYSPIRFTDTSDPGKNNPLTQRKASTFRGQNANNLQDSPIMNQQSVDYRDNPIGKSKFSKYTKLNSLQIQQNQQSESARSKSQKKGKIVSNNNRLVTKQCRRNQCFKSKNIQFPKENALQTREIIKKVRNFNDFLNEIKRKLKQDKQSTIIRNRSRLDCLKNPSTMKRQTYNTFNKDNFQTWGQIKDQVLQDNIYVDPITLTPFRQSTPSNRMYKSKSMRRIEVELKLQNEKLELQKYRKLVERELSKTHSIQNISLCTKHSGQKVLTIQYESMLPQSPLSEDNFNKASLKKQPSQRTLINKMYQNNLMQDRPHQVRQPKGDPHSSNRAQSIMVRRVKMQYQRMFKNMLQLGKIIENYEENVENSDERILIKEGSEGRILGRLNQNISDLEGGWDNIKEKGVKLGEEKQQKVQRIQVLFSRLNQIQSQYQETDRQIRQAISNSYSDSQLQDSAG